MAAFNTFSASLTALDQCHQLEFINPYALFTARHVESAYSMTIGYGKDDVEDTTAALASAIDASSSRALNVFGAEYYRKGVLEVLQETRRPPENSIC
jgi:hypothetical protein